MYQFFVYLQGFNYKRKHILTFYTSAVVYLWFLKRKDCIEIFPYKFRGRKFEWGKKCRTFLESHEYVLAFLYLWPLRLIVWIETRIGWQKYSFSYLVEVALLPQFKIVENIHLSVLIFWFNVLDVCIHCVGYAWGCLLIYGWQRWAWWTCL